MQGEVDKHTHPDSQFIPSRAAKHRVPKTFSRKNPTQKYKDRGVPTQERTLRPEEISLDEEDENEANISSQSDNDEDYQPHAVGNGDTTDEPDDIVPPCPEPLIPERRIMPARKRRGKNRKYMSTTAAESSSEEEIRIGQKGRVNKDIEKKKMNTNPPTYVRIRPIIKRCQGCRVLFDKSECIAPNDLVFRYVMRREYPDKDNPGQWKVGDKPGNAYFHSRDLACLKRISELSNVNETHIYIEDGIYHSLTEEHFELLDRRGHLVPLRKTCAKLI